MSGEINRVPSGLLSLLDMTARGQNPRLLSAELQAGIDILPLYLYQRATNANDSVVVNSVGYFGFNTQGRIPEQQLWYVWSGTITPSAALVGAGLIRFAPCIYRNPGAVTFLAGETLSYQGQAGDIPNVRIEPGWYMPGDVFGVHVAEWAAFTVDPTMLLRLSYTPLRV